MHPSSLLLVALVLAVSTYVLPIVASASNATACNALPTMVPASVTVIALADVPFYSVFSDKGSVFPYFDALSPSESSITTASTSTTLAPGATTKALSTQSGTLSYFEVDASELSQGTGILINGLEGGMFSVGYTDIVVPSLLISDTASLLSNSSGNLRFIRIPAYSSFPGFVQDESYISGGYVQYPIRRSSAGPLLMISVKTKLLGNLLGSADDVVVDMDWRSEEGHGFEDLIGKSFGDVKVAITSGSVSITFDSFTSYRISRDEFVYINFYNDVTTPSGCAGASPVIVRIKAFAQSFMDDGIQAIAFGVMVFGLIAVLGRGSVPTSHQAGMFGILSFTHFAQEDGNPLPLILNPIQASIGSTKYQYVQGALLANLCIVLGVGLMQIGAVTYLQKTQYIPKLESHAIVRYPSLLVAVAVHLTPSTFFCIGRNFGNQNNFISYSLAVINFAAFFLVVLALGAWKLQNPPITFGALRKPLEIRPVIKFQNDNAATTEQRVLSYLVQQYGEWEDTKATNFMIDRFGWIFENYTFEGRFRTVLEFFDSVVIGVLAVADNHTATLAILQYSVYLLVKSVLLVALVYRNPITTPASAVVCLISYSCQTIASLALVVGSINPAILSSAYIVRDVALVVGILALATDCLLTTFRHVLTFRAALQQTNEKREMQRQRVIRDALIRLTEADLDGIDDEYDDLTPISSTTSETHSTDDAHGSNEEEEDVETTPEEGEEEEEEALREDADHGHAKQLRKLEGMKRRIRQQCLEEAPNDAEAAKRLYHRRKRRLRRFEVRVAMDRLEVDSGVAGKLDGDTKTRMTRLYKGQMKAERKRARQEGRVKRAAVIAKRRQARKEHLFSTKALSPRQLAALTIPDGAKLLPTADTDEDGPIALDIAEEWNKALELREATDPTHVRVDTGFRDTLVEGYLPGSDGAMAVIRRRERYREAVGAGETILTVEERRLVDKAIKKSSKRSSQTGSRRASRMASRRTSISGSHVGSVSGKLLNFDDVTAQLGGASSAPTRPAVALTTLQKAKLIQVATQEISDTSTSSNSSRDSEGLPIMSYEQEERKKLRRAERELRRDAREGRREARERAIRSLKGNPGLDEEDAIPQSNTADRVREFVQASLEVTGGGGRISQVGEEIPQSIFASSRPRQSEADQASVGDPSTTPTSSSSLGLEFSTNSRSSNKGTEEDDSRSSDALSAKSGVSRVGSVTAAVYKMRKRDKYESRGGTHALKIKEKKKKRKQLRIPQNVQVMKQFSRLVSAIPNLSLDERAIHRRVFYEKLLEIEATEEREQENRERVATVRRRRMREAKRRDVQLKKERAILGLQGEVDHVQEGTHEHYNNLLATSSAEGLIKGRPSLIQRLRHSLTHVNRSGGRRVVKQPLTEALDEQSARELAAIRQKRNPKTDERRVSGAVAGEDLIETMDLVSRKRRKDMQGRWLDEQSGEPIQPRDDDSSVGSAASHESNNSKDADVEQDYEEDLMRILYTNPRGIALAAQEAATVHDALEARGRVQAAAAASAAASERRRKDQSGDQGDNDNAADEEMDDVVRGVNFAERERAEALIRQERSKKLGLLLAVWNSIGEETAAQIEP